MKIVFYEMVDWEVEYLKQRLPGHEIVSFAAPCNESNMPDPEADIISPFIGSKLNQTVLDAATSLKAVMTRSTGFDHIDLGACAKRSISVSNVPTYGENTVAEYTFALLLTLSRKMYPSIKRIREQGWFATEGLRGFDLKGKTLGVIGTGHIGAYVVRIAKGFGMQIAAFDPKPNKSLAKEFGFSYMPLEEVLRQADVLTLHVPYLPATHHLLNKNNLELVKPGCVLINTSRGGLVETEALVDGLRRGIFAGAALDVLEEEGFVRDEVDLLIDGHPQEAALRTALADHELMHMDNVIITPHNAFQTTEAIKRILDTTAANIEAFVEGEPKNVVTER